MLDTEQIFNHIDGIRSELAEESEARDREIKRLRDELSALKKFIQENIAGFNTNSGSIDHAEWGG